MKLLLELDLDNAAFEDDFEGELSRILEDVAQRCPTQANVGDCVLHDVNGNYTGKFRVED